MSVLAWLSVEASSTDAYSRELQNQFGKPGCGCAGVKSTESSLTLEAAREKTNTLTSEVRSC